MYVPISLFEQTILSRTFIMLMHLPLYALPLNDLFFIEKEFVTRHDVIHRTQTEPSTYFQVEYDKNICIEASVLLLLHLIK